MKTKSFCAFLAIIALLITSCGGGNKDVSVKNNSSTSSELNQAYPESSSSSSISSESTSISSDSDSDEEVTSTDNAGSEDWNKLLDSYESYIDQYLKLMKKVNAGDMSVMSEYTSMMVKGTEFVARLETAGDDLSASQMARFTKLQAKLLDAASESLGTTSGSLKSTSESIDDALESLDDALESLDEE